MSQQNKGARLYKRPARKGGRKSVWVIRDGESSTSTGVLVKPGERRPPEEAEKALSKYIATKYNPERKLRDVDEILLADVLAIYYKHKVKEYDEETQELQIRRLKQSITRLGKYFGKKYLGAMNSDMTDGYVKHRGSKGGARRDLENLRAAVNHHGNENLHRAVISVNLPEKGDRRERWLQRSEAAHLLWTCWRYKEEQTIHRGKNKGIKIKTGKYTLRHLARFILIGLYTGTRAAAIASASIHKATGKSYVDLDEGVYHRLAIGKKKSNKRQPIIPLPDRLLAHMRRWVDRGIVASHFVEWNGAAIKSVKTAMASAVELAKLDLSEGNVTPHTLRHTAATWLMQQGCDIWEASGYLGMSPKVLIDNYGHHHPDYMSDATNLITKKRGPGKRSRKLSRVA
ncbi:tyrosine-type recombinase/integrase [Bradyrhizobium hipponense]|uniref:Tyrosine-type recombinase/integrase n=1 Tax=Bradyrhizobium hipponense TaxID=2605638 RepID=A0A5S4YPV6_9BRAD|nr:tyrosine-type recombinase/integrase [Bradyrhizobium hipponense]TYO65405.1 tyrosine-type recombinase/integrase [Bradyrhizobium hipponense]